jgi:hypothetical protein
MTAQAQFGFGGAKAERLGPPKGLFTVWLSSERQVLGFKPDHLPMR